MRVTGETKQIDQKALSTLFERYETLCRYCDDFFTQVFNEYPAQIRCTKGCASCCLLETVAPLEAYIITSYLQQRPNIVVIPEDSTSCRAPSDEGQCIFLTQGACRIYPVRPIICRTHGLPIQYPDQLEYDVCPLNFAEIDLKSIDERYVLDAELITTNFMRLNLAFCLLTQSADAAEERIPLDDIFHGKYPLDRKKSPGPYYPA